jgi:hypothetical protein
MNKKVNTALFIIGATVVNLIMMMIFIFVGLFLVSLIPMENANQGVATVAVILVFFGAIVGSFFVYHRLIKFISARVDMDKYFHPIFKKKSK